jgi:hypothetical protein
MGISKLLLAVIQARRRKSLLMHRDAPQRLESDQVNPAKNEGEKMPSEFDFLDKHFYATEDVDLAAQGARDRFKDYPGARTSTVIYNMDWEILVERINRAVINFGYGAIFPASGAFAYLGDYQGGQQWNIVLTGLDYVNAAMKVVGMGTEYTVSSYTRGPIVVNALAVGQNPPMLGEIVHLQAAMGDFVADIPLK